MMDEHSGEFYDDFGDPWPERLLEVGLLAELIGTLDVSTGEALGDVIGESVVFELKKQ